MMSHESFPAGDQKEGVTDNCFSGGRHWDQEWGTGTSPEVIGGMRSADFHRFSLSRFDSMRIQISQRKHQSMNRKHDV